MRSVTKVEDWLTCSEMMIMDGSRKGTLFPGQAGQVPLCSDYLPRTTGSMYLGLGGLRGIADAAV